jgi:hypothetical protein
MEADSGGLEPPLSFSSHHAVFHDVNKDSSVHQSSIATGTSAQIHLNPPMATLSVVGATEKSDAEVISAVFRHPE